jgi:oxalate decarboxylase/phosphoglucose isomerase-like protein (cupin superfamily)
MRTTQFSLVESGNGRSLHVHPGVDVPPVQGTTTQ